MIDYFINRLKVKKKLFIGMKYQLKKQTRLTLDYKKDYILFKKIFENFSIFTERKDINNFLKKNHEIRNKNIHLNKMWGNKQKNFITPILR